MTIAKRLMILLAVPLVALLGLGVFTRVQLARIEAHSRFVAESRIAALATLGNLSRGFSEMRVNVRSYLLATDAAGRKRARDRRSTRTSATSPVSCRSTPTTWSSGGRDQRLLATTRRGRREWVAGARQVMALVGQGRRDEAVNLLNGRSSDIGFRLSKRLERVDCSRRGVRHGCRERIRPGHRAVSDGHADRELRGVPADRRAGVPDVPANRWSHSSARRIRPGTLRKVITRGPFRSSKPVTRPAAWRDRSTSSSTEPRPRTSSAGSRRTSRGSPASFRVRRRSRNSASGCSRG